MRCIFWTLIHKFVIFTKKQSLLANWPLGNCSWANCPLGELSMGELSAGELPVGESSYNRSMYVHLIRVLAHIEYVLGKKFK